MKRICRALCAFLAVLMLCALLPVTAFAELTKSEPPLDTWVETDSQGNNYVFVRPGADDGKVYCNGVPGEMLDLGPFSIYVRNTIDDQYLYINEIWAKRIRCAPENGSVQINAEGWYSLNFYVADAIAERPDVSVEFDHLVYETQQRVSLVLPAGTDVKGQMDGKEVIEFQELARKLGIETPVIQ